RLPLSRPMSRLQTVGARLSLALLLVVAVALGVVYLVVVPSLRHRLVNSRLSQVEREAPRLSREYVQNPGEFNFSDAASSTGARVVLLELYEEKPLALRNIGDSFSARGSNVENDRIAVRVVLTAKPQHGTVTRDNREFAEAAAPLTGGQVLLLSAPLKGVLADVQLVQQRILIAGLLALLVALLLGFGGATAFAGRIRRLERAADRIARGEFDEPVADNRTDELGQLSRAFDRMRVRLAQLDRARREFIANASHELRTPLFSLGGFLELLRDEDLDEETRREFLATMGEQVERLTKLAQELLDLNRLDAGQLRLERQQLDLAKLGGEIVEEFAAIARAQDHPLELVENGSVAVVGDEQRVLQIGRILVENALVHTPAGTTVRVTAKREDGRAVLDVEDAGPGIAGEHAQHIFDRFYRAEGGRASGSGLGLAIARELAELMEGRIELDSRPGRTVFSLVLPT
ncbi:MAG: ATP-binding protein, partial [Gaiellaceae bacterium]